MDFQLTRDLVFLDLEATGLHVIRDRIVQIALIKYEAGGGGPEELSMLINPGIPISAEAMSVHGIRPEDVARKPTFAQVAQKLFDFIGGADLAGYNSNRFDIPMLMEEFHRAGLDFRLDDRRCIDVQRIFYKMEPRTLPAALRFYCDESLDNAHDALADVRATIKVLKGQLQRYDGVDLEDADGNISPAPVRNDVQALHEFTTDLRFLDATQRLREDEDGNVVLNFGKYRGQSLREVFLREPNYLNWMLNNDFSVQVKHLVKKLKEAYEAEHRSR